jgi:hypothetical protein
VNVRTSQFALHPGSKQHKDQTFLESCPR